jgi:hypothetical protein
MGLCLVSHTVVQHLLASALGPQMAAVERVAALPLPGWGLLRWRGIAETRSSYLVSRVTLVPLTVTPPEVVAKGSDTSLVRAVSTNRLVRLFLHVARFPVVEFSTREAEQIVRYFDLRSTGDGRHRSRFDLVVRLNAAGQVQAIEFLGRVFPHPASPPSGAPASGGPRLSLSWSATSVDDEHLVCAETVRQQFGACRRHEDHVLNMPVAHMRFEGEDHALL